jgi:hypothetical protein
MAVDTNAIAYWPFSTSSLTDAIGSVVLTSQDTTFESAAPGPARLSNGSGAPVLYNNSFSFTTAGALTIALEVYFTSSATSVVIAGICFGDSDYYTLELQGSFGSGVGARKRSGGSADDAINATGWGVGSWMQIALVVPAGSGSIKCILNGNTVTTTGSVTPSGGYSRVAVAGISRDSLNAGPTNVRYRNFAIWNADKSSDLAAYFSNPSSILGSVPASPTLTGLLQTRLIQGRLTS